MTVNETYFFREAYQFDCLVNSHAGRSAAAQAAGRAHPHLVGAVVHRRGTVLDRDLPARTLAARSTRYDVEILSSDIDTTVLEAAQRGMYSAAFGGTACQRPTCRSTSTQRKGEYEWVISRDLVAAVEFSRVNLTLSRDDTRAFRDIDIVFCRNLLIYFDDLSRRVAAEAMFDALNPGGFPLPGAFRVDEPHHSSLFNVRRFADAMVYQKPLHGCAQMNAPDVLIVDDAATVRMYHRKMLARDAGWQVDEASNGMEALEKVHEAFGRNRGLRPVRGRRQHAQDGRLQLRA
jgi:chemotaxis protein methyltransferase CheR